MHITIDIPDQYIFNDTSENLAKQFRLYTALFMFRAGQLSAGSACELAGIDRYTFISVCKLYNIDVIAYDEEELETDFEQLKKCCTDSKLPC